MVISKCEECIPIPAWTDKAVSVSCIFITLMIALICYAKREASRHRTFYGKEDHLTEREKKEPLSDAERQWENELDAYLMGTSTGEVHIRKEPLSTRKSPGDRGRYCVMVPQKKKSTTPIADSGVLQMTPEKPSIAVPSSNSPYKLLLQVISDKTGRANELLDELKKKNVPHGQMEEVVDGIIFSILEILEGMTRKYFMVVGTMVDGTIKKTIIRGQEHFPDVPDGFTLQMKLQLIHPYKVLIIAYQFEIVSVESKDEPAPTGQLNPDFKEEPEPPSANIQTDVTPQTPMLNSCNPSNRGCHSLVMQGGTSETHTFHRPTRLTPSAITNALMRSKMTENFEYYPPSASMLQPVPPPPASPIKQSESRHLLPESNRRASVRKKASKASSRNKTQTVIAKSAEKLVKESQRARTGPGNQGNEMKLTSQKRDSQETTRVKSRMDSKPGSKKKHVSSTGHRKRKSSKEHVLEANEKKKDSSKMSKEAAAAVEQILEK